MTRYAAFLRGVNLGKRQVKSADLLTAFTAMGFDNVKTLLASGNVLFDAKATKGLKARIEAGLFEQFGFAVPTVLRSVDELAAMVQSDPFGRAESERRGPRGRQGAGLPPGSRRHHRRRPLVGFSPRQDRRTGGASRLSSFL